MSAQQQTGFGHFIPGFDFLQNLAKGASAPMPKMPNLSSWVAPTFNVEELEKRIGELKAVQFWLEQNTNALAATIQALEVQKMTLATLKGMNFKMPDIAEAMKVKPAAEPGEGAKGAKASGPTARPGDAQAEQGKVVDPLQWWGALTQQFQEIAANAMHEVAASTETGKGTGSRKAAPAKSAPGAKRPRRKTSAG
jgi:hypothetical protein